MPVVAVSKVLRERLTDEGVDEFIEILSEVEEEARKDSLVIAEERFERRLAEEVAKIRVEIASLRTELKSETASLRTELKSETASLKTEMALFKAEIIKWMFLFWVGQLVIIAGMIKWLR
ncbi:MAG: hypothetical protein HY096_14230 [Nitrospinae bacterium]|nr:hypothetical protein [Nitrospinota bacterium]MBI5749829.1 hypothetical protein [Nitrospinota bacterium]